MERNKLTDIEYIKQVQRDLHVVFGDEGGQRVLDFINQISGVDTSLPFISGEHAILEKGRREVALTIRTLIKLKPEEVANYYQEGE